MMSSELFITYGNKCVLHEISLARALTHTNKIPPLMSHLLIVTISLK